MIDNGNNGSGKKSSSDRNGKNGGGSVGGLRRGGRSGAGVIDRGGTECGGVGADEGGRVGASSGTACGGKGEGTRARGAGKAGGSGLGGCRSLQKHLKYLVPEMRLALIREPGPRTHKILRPDDVELFVEPLRHYSEEYFLSFHLSATHDVIGYCVVSHGTLSASLVHPREVFKAAILANSFAILVAHNHPGGSTNPSREDLDTTRQLIQAGKIIGVNVVDHVIVSVNGITSIREEHPDMWA